QMAELNELMNNGLIALRQSGKDLAVAEEAYRLARRDAWKNCPADMLAKEREDWVNAETAPYRRVRDGADLDRQTALEAVRRRRTQVSALQSLMAAYRAEAACVRGGGDIAA